jgi:hypothetical protein
MIRLFACSPVLPFPPALFAIGERLPRPPQSGASKLATLQLVHAKRIRLPVTFDVYPVMGCEFPDGIGDIHQIAMA